MSLDIVLVQVNIKLKLIQLEILARTNLVICQISPFELLSIGKQQQAQQEQEARR